MGYDQAVIDAQVIINHAYCEARKVSKGRYWDLFDSEQGSLDVARALRDWAQGREERQP